MGMHAYMRIIFFFGKRARIDMYKKLQTVHDIDMHVATFMWNSDIRC